LKKKKPESKPSIRPFPDAQITHTPFAKAGKYSRKKEEIKPGRNPDSQCLCKYKYVFELHHGRNRYAGGGSFGGGVTSWQDERFVGGRPKHA
jgi:hypothetical protein